MSGWFRIHREIFTHEMFERQQYSEREAFLWIVANAAWKPTGHRVKNEIFPVPRGSFFTTIRLLMTEWKWSNTKVSRFLKNLEKQDMIKTETGTGKTLVTICNYSKFQDEEILKRHEGPEKKTNKRQTKDTKEEINNLINN